MTNRTFTFIAFAYGVSIIGCASDTIGGPPRVQPPVVEPPPVLARISIKPSLITLLPGMTITLTLAAFDQRGREFNWTDGAVAYSSSDPAIAAVDNRGVVTAISAGTAVISTTLALNGQTSTAFVNSDVVALRPGKYELAAPVTESGWGVSGRYSALLALSQDSSPTEKAAFLIGRFEAFRLIGLEGDTVQSVSAGIVKAEVDVLGRLRVQLFDGKVVWWEGTVSSADQDGFRGSYAVGDGFAAGSFTVKRLDE